MYKLFLVCLMSIFCFHVNGQDLNLASIQQEVKLAFPETDFTDKLIVVTVWNSESASLREMNKEMIRVYNFYKGAKFKDGLKGIIFLSLSSDVNELQHLICLKKDFNDFKYSLCDFKGFATNSILSKININPTLKNAVFNCKGTLIYQNIDTESIYKSLNALLTR